MKRDNIISGIIMASGYSKRMKQDKLLLEIEGIKVIERVIMEAKKSRLGEVIMVYRTPLVGEIGLLYNIKVVKNLQPQKGQSESMKIGIEAADINTKGYMFLVGDQPFIDSEIINALIDRFNENQSKIIIPTFNGQRCNPVIFPAAYKGELLKIKGDQGGREIINNNKENQITVEIQEGYRLMDMDTQEEYTTISLWRAIMKNNIAVIATGNKHKLQEIGAILKNFSLEIKSMKDVNLEGLNIVEDGNTFEENALIKARKVMEKTGYMAIADDSGLEVDVLDNQPGIFSARFAGEDATDEENNIKLLKLLEGVPYEKRTGRFVCAIAAVFPDGEAIVLRGEKPGIIGFEPKGKGGFGYDPLFIVPEYNLTFAEIDAGLKNKISHRAIALHKLKEALDKKLGCE